MFALKARALPASLASARRHRANSRVAGRDLASQVVRVAEFEPKTKAAVKKISVPAVEVDGETPLDILNDGADAFAELVALNKPKQSVNRPQKVRSIGDGDRG